MDANRLLASVADAYVSLSSYSDEGVVNTTLRMPEASFQHTIKFFTAYVKPNLFRFKFENPHPYPPLAHVITTHICGFDGTSAYLRTQLHDQPAEVRIETQFDMAVAGATGISGGSVRTIATRVLRANDVAACALKILIVSHHCRCEISYPDAADFAKKKRCYREHRLVKCFCHKFSDSGDHRL